MARALKLILITYLKSLKETLRGPTSKHAVTIKSVQHESLKASLSQEARWIVLATISMIQELSCLDVSSRHHSCRVKPKAQQPWSFIRGFCNLDLSKIRLTTFSTSTFEICKHKVTTFNFRIRFRCAHLHLFDHEMRLGRRA